MIIAQILAARFGVALEEEGKGQKALQDWQPRYNIAPSQLNPVVVMADDRGKQMLSMKWGLVPSWSREPKTRFSTINARAETVTQKPAFRKLLSSKRCLVPATGYFEWAATEGKQPYRVQVRYEGLGTESGIMAMAGLYDVWVRRISA